MKIKMTNLVPFEMVASYNECSIEQAIQEAYALMLNIGGLTKAKREELGALKAQNDRPTTEIDIELTAKHAALLDKLMMSRSVDEINAKVFDVSLGYLFLPKETQRAIDKILQWI